MTVIALDSLSKKICRDLLRDGMRAAIGTTITDPKAATRPAASPMILTAWPDRTPFFPIIIVSESNSSGGRIARTDALEEHDYAASIEIVSENTTHLYTLRDQIRKWIGLNVTTFANAGWIDVNIVSSTPTTWDPTSVAKTWQLVLKGKAFTD